MKVLGISPGNICNKGEPRRDGTSVGLLSVLGELRAKKNNVSYLDVVAKGYSTMRQSKINPNVNLFGLNPVQIKEEIKKINPDVILISALHTSRLEPILEVIATTNEISPNVPIIIGGHFATSCQDYFLENGADYIVLGEGEKTIVELVKSLEQESKKDFSLIKGIAYKDKKGKVIITAPRPFTKNLDEFIGPAFDLMNLDLYRNKERSHYGNPKKSAFVDLIMSRGCPRGCDFCTSTSMMGCRIRAYSPERITNMIQGLDSAGWEEFIIEDDEVLMLRKQHPNSYYAYINALKQTKKPWAIDAGLYYPNITEEFIKEIADAGCYRVFLPVENPDMGIMHKNGKYREIERSDEVKDKIKKIGSLFKSYGIDYYHVLITGFPGYTKKQVKADIEFAKFLKNDCKASFVGFFCAHPLPGTELYRQSYNEIDPKRAWDKHPEYMQFTEPIFPGKDYTTEWLKKTLSKSQKMINKTDSLNIGHEPGSIS